MLAVGCFFIVGGRLGDVFGRRPVLPTGTALFAAWTAARTLVLLAVAAVSGVLFVLRERTARHPLVDLRLFRDVSFDLITTMGSVFNMGYAVTVFIATLYLQGVRGLSAPAAGTVFLAPAVVVALAGPTGPVGTPVAAANGGRGV
ncbi:hypothetical protein GCM10010495_52530 [Kitasatospora herbaricolor]|nr:hypothetical protein GCM10010495_52530 [Kitasatospora herbaricolor]